MIDIKPKMLLLKVSQSNIDKYASVLSSAMDKNGINTENRVNFFLSQIAHESNNFQATKENMNYSAAQMVKTWPNLFRDINIAKRYVKKPVELANYVYGNRMGNNGTSDGSKYLGRGLVGTTGKEQYAKTGSRLGIDLINKPELLETPLYAALSAVDFWMQKNLNLISDTGNYEKVTKSINGGLIGIGDRMMKLKSLQGVKNNPITSIAITVIFFSIFAYAIMHNKQIV